MESSTTIPTTGRRENGERADAEIDEHARIARIDRPEEQEVEAVATAKYLSSKRNALTKDTKGSNKQIDNLSDNTPLAKKAHHTHVHNWFTGSTHFKNKAREIFDEIDFDSRCVFTCMCVCCVSLFTHTTHTH